MNRCAWGQNRELSLQKKMDSKSGGEGTKEGNGTQETNGFIHNVILQHVRCVIRQSTETVFMVVVCVMEAGGGFES